jgi:hypothetical protein
MAGARSLCICRRTSPHIDGKAAENQAAEGFWELGVEGTAANYLLIADFRMQDCGGVPQRKSAI